MAMSMFRWVYPTKYLSWEASDNCKGEDYPLKITRYIPSEIVDIESAKLSFSIEPFRAYTTTSQSNSEQTQQVAASADRVALDETSTGWQDVATITSSDSAYTIVNVNANFFDNETHSQAHITTKVYVRIYNETDGEYYPNSDGVVLTFSDSLPHKHKYGSSYTESNEYDSNSILDFQTTSPRVTIIIPKSTKDKTMKIQAKLQNAQTSGTEFSVDYSYQSISKHTHDMSYDIYEQHSEMHQDNFDDNNLDTTYWEELSGLSTPYITVSETNQRLEFTTRSDNVAKYLKGNSQISTTFEIEIDKSDDGGAYVRYTYIGFYVDDNNYVYFRAVTDNPNKNFYTLYKVVDGTTTMLYTTDDLTFSKDVKLKLVRSGNNWTGYWSIDGGQTWSNTDSITINDSVFDTTGYPFIGSGFGFGYETRKNYLDNFYVCTIPKISIKINGVDRTTELGGPWNSDQYNLEIKDYLNIGSWNTIELIPDYLARLSANILVTAIT